MVELIRKEFKVSVAEPSGGPSDTDDRVPWLYQNWYLIRNLVSGEVDPRTLLGSSIESVERDKVPQYQHQPTTPGRNLYRQPAYSRGGGRGCLYCITPFLTENILPFCIERVG